MPKASTNVRVRGRSGKHILALSSSQFDPTATLAAPAVALSDTLEEAGPRLTLQNCGNSHDGLFCLRTQAHSQHRRRRLHPRLVKVPRPMRLRLPMALSLPLRRRAATSDVTASWTASR